MYYIYILYSEKAKLYYVGYSSDPVRRLIEHNSTPFNTFTAKHRPWLLKASFECSTSESDAIKVERFIKKQKSRRLVWCNYVWYNLLIYAACSVNTLFPLRTVTAIIRFVDIGVRFLLQVSIFNLCT